MQQEAAHLIDSVAEDAAKAWAAPLLEQGNFIDRMYIYTMETIRINFLNLVNRVIGI